MVLGGGDHIYTSQTLTGGKVTAIMGGGKIDLRKANCVGDQLTLDCFAFWGGIEIIVPYHWNVNVQGTPIMGGIENKASSLENIEGIEVNLDPKTLIIKGAVVMGGIEIKN